MPGRVARSGSLEHPPGGIQNENGQENGHGVVGRPPGKGPEAIAQQPQADGHRNSRRDEGRLIDLYFTQREEIDEDAGGVQGVGGDEEVEEEEAQVQEASGDADVGPEAGLGVDEVAGNGWRKRREKRVKESR
jgi:hypothetical protein